ncbi:MAG TPA: glycosyltransferase family 2 protein, partial [Candidatus Hydrogenedentes bacterium]|nr:glycosyltransferase family 2 protein [Candidatus Hydrogenedentota bacterium]
MSSTEKIPAISVITPVYNNASYLPEALDSILGQTFSDFEFILVNDGSTDNSLEVLETYARRDPRIRISSRENRGYISALNEGLAMARSEFIARMDADDVALP